ncbi:MAG: glutamine--fructose-6-phosphate transaminase (isomerizing) [Planctomycetota bacterium]|nr:MAG: glutamine--fructose-6-phosphate transaminase (isomerizing) [Planctomycetota bacterium]
MCGIVGAVSRSGAVLEGLLDGLRKLEYRGYDSCGVAMFDPGLANGAVQIRRKVGRLTELEKLLADGALGAARAGIGHTRWATHGKPSDENAHPHTDGSGRMALVHNGIIENYLELRAELTADGAVFRSETDTEVLTHLVGRELARGKSLLDAVRASLRRVQGYYAIAVMALENGPDGKAAARLVCARQGPPLVVAATPEIGLCGSDVLALLKYTRDVVFVEDGDIVELAPGRIAITDFDGKAVARPVRHVDWDEEAASKGGFPHHMLKEIHEQPDVLARTAFDRILQVEGDVDFEGAGFDDARLRAIERIQVVACGTALHAGMIGKYLIENLAGVAVDCDFASEFRYREPVLAPRSAVLAISQSGETADTLAAMRLARERGLAPLSICNVQGSTVVRESEGVILTHAGPEIGVASTKAFVAQVIASYLLAVRLGRARGKLSVEQGRELLDELRRLRPRLEGLITEKTVERVRSIAVKHLKAKGFFFLGRGVNFPVALEGALKLKEISYVHAEGYAAGEMKHGPIALIEPGMPIVVINSPGRVADKVRSNIEQVKARGGHVISIGADEQSHALADESIPVPASSEWLSPLLNVVPLQLFAYHHALARGCDIDKPRNLAKSVTVE